MVAFGSTRVLRPGLSSWMAVSLLAAAIVVASVAPALAADAAPGRAVFHQECAVCHGDGGEGDGELASLLDPKPRDFRRGLYKLRSTESGELPTDTDLLATIENGIPGTGMPSFRHLDAKAKRDVMAFVKTLGGPENEEGSWFELYEVPAAVSVPPSPAPAEASVALGRKLYSSMGCDGCHGKDGRGDGKRPEELLDDWGNPLHARNFHIGVYKGGSQPQDLYTRVMTGMDGTPMTGFWKDVMSPDERWAVVGYLMSLRTPVPVQQPSRGRVAVVSTSLPTDIADPAWQKVTPASVLRMPLTGGWLRYFEPLDVRAVTADGRLAVLVSWPAESDEGCCSLRVMFSSRQRESTFHLGDETAPLLVWEWRSGSGTRAYESKGPATPASKVDDIETETVEEEDRRRVVLEGPAPRDAKHALVQIAGCARGEDFVTASTFFALQWSGP